MLVDIKFLLSRNIDSDLITFITQKLLFSKNFVPLVDCCKEYFKQIVNVCKLFLVSMDLDNLLTFMEVLDLFRGYAISPFSPSK